MKILYLTEQVYRHGGAEKIMMQKLNYWADVFGYEVMLVTFEQNGNPVCYPMSEKVKHMDLNIGYMPGSYFSPKNIIKFPKHYRALQQQVRTFNPDAIFLVSLSWIRFALPFIAKGYNIYNEYHTSFSGFQMGYDRGSAWVKIKKKLSDLLVKSAEDRYTNIIFLNQKEAAFFNRKNGVVIPNFFDASLQAIDVPKKKQAISLGRLSYEKGYDLLIEAWETVYQSYPDWSLEIYGEGDKRQELQKLIDAKKLDSVVRLRGATNAVSLQLSESEIYVLSSRVDNFPMVLLEAMSNQLPVVAFDCPNGPGEILSDGQDAVLVPRENVQALALAIIGLIQNPELRRQMGAKGFENVQRFNAANVMAQWDALIKSHAKPGRKH